MASTETMTYQDNLDSQYLSSSISSLSRSRSTNSLIVRTYKQATQLYLTKRFKEAFETLAPIVEPQHAQSDGVENGETEQAQNGVGAAPIAQSSRGTRTKVWVFYLSLLHAIIELGSEEGKLVLGSTKWKQLAAKARDGTVWEEIVQAGYGGNEGEVDAEVVVNLATLLLGHMQSQRLNQQRLETWLASSPSVNAGQHVMFADGTMSPVPNGSSTPSSTPKALATRLKILELYTLHVLPANEEWKYAQEFIEMNDSLDDERRDAFLHALESLKEQSAGTAQREKDLKEQREREMEEQRKQEEAARAEEARQADERRKAAEAETRRPVKSDVSASSSKAVNGTAKPTSSSQHKAAPQASSKPSKAGKKPPSPPPTLYRRASSVLVNLQQMVLQASRSMTGNSAAMFRLLMFMLAFLVIIARRDLRLKIQRVLDDGWVKVKRTVGMGVKVSYI